MRYGHAGHTETFVGDRPRIPSSWALLVMWVMLIVNKESLTGLRSVEVSGIANVRDRMSLRCVSLSFGILPP